MQRGSSENRSVVLIVLEKLLALKTSVFRKDIGDRTAIRHWWIGVNAPKRTSDASLRNSAN